MRARAVVLAVALVLAPLGAQAADLVVWWDEGYYAEEDEAVREIIAAFEQETGKQVELVFHPEEELPDAIAAALEAGPAARLRLRLRLPTTSDMGPRGSARGPLGRRRPLFGPVRSGRARRATLAQRKNRAKGPVRAADGPHDQPPPRLEEPAGARGLHRSTTSRRSGRRSGRSGATRSSRRCARPLGRDDIWGVGLPMSVGAATPRTSSSSSWLPTRRTT